MCDTTKLDEYELAQLLNLFYTVRDDTELVVEDEVATRSVTPMDDTRHSDTHANVRLAITKSWLLFSQ